MKSDSLNNNEDPAPAVEKTANDEVFEQLRHLLLEPEQSQLKQLHKRIDNIDHRTEDVSNVLPDAILLRSRRDTKLSAALMPTVEEIIDLSVKRDTKPLINALTPVIGRLIRKSISETFRQMMQTINHAIENSFSIQGLKWRITAIRTGKSFAEIVLLNCLVYRVEQIFLIHRKTGLLLQHVIAEEATVKDGDMISGMLKAIQDFIHDSFETDSDNTLETIQVGDLSVLIEQGAHAILAGVVSGNPPENLRTKFQDTLGSIHLKLTHELKSFDGETSPFESVWPELNTCLLAKYKSKKKKTPPIFWAVLAALLVIGGYWTTTSIQKNMAWKDFLQTLKVEEGIVIIATEKRNNQYFISGLRDPLAVNPGDLWKTTPLAAKQLISKWQPYQALNQEFILTRANKTLAPPDTVALTFKDGVLIAEGIASQGWIDTARTLAKAIPGIHKYRDVLVKKAKPVETIFEKAKRILNPPDTVTLSFSNARMTASGSAPHQWIVNARKTIKGFLGIKQYIDKDLVTTDQLEMAEIIKKVESTMILFSRDTILASEEQTHIVQQIADKLLEIKSISTLTGDPVYVVISGHADKVGEDEFNTLISKKRAEKIRVALINKGINPDTLYTEGVGSTEQLPDTEGKTKSQLNRRVSFKIKRGQKEMER